MSLTVAKRIVAGFSALTLLLIVGGASALLGLYEIEQHQTEISQQAVPSLNSNHLQSQRLSRMETQLVLAQQAEAATYLDGRLQQFIQLRDQFAAALPALTAFNAAVPELFGQYVEATDAFFNYQQQALSLRAQQASANEALTLAVDEVGGLLLDFADEVADQQAGLADAAQTLESALVQMLAASSELARELDAGKAVNLFEELEYQQQRVADVAGPFIRQARAADSELLGDLDAQLQQLVALANTEQAPQRLHRQRLSALQSAQTQSVSSMQLQIELELTLEEVLSQTLAEVETSDQSLSTAVARTDLLMIIVTVVSVLAAVAISIITIRSIIRPLDRVNSMLNVIAGGDLTQALPEQGNDEFTLLSRNVNALVGSLRSLIEDINTNATQLASAAEETSAISLQTTAGIEQQRGQIDQSASATTQLTSSAEQVAGSAQESLEAVKQATAEAATARETSQQNKQQIERLDTELRSASVVINQLAEDSGQIGTVLDVIRNIAEQTNLLALNAAIEAARAGEQGRGFAVVADEVRALASRTQASTTEIQTMIEKLQQGAMNAVSSMEQSAHITEACVEQSDQTDVALQSVATSMHSISEQSYHIANASSEQLQVSAEIHQKLVEMVNIAEETSAGASQTAQASEEVARLSAALQVSVSQFKW